MNKLPFILGILVAISSSAWSQILFSQNFSSSSVFTNYFNATSPDSGQFNTYTLGTNVSNPFFTNQIASQTMRFLGRTNAGANGGASFVRSTDLNPNPSAVQFSFRFGLSGSYATSSVASITAGFMTFGLGNGYTNEVFGTAAGTVNAVDSLARVTMNLNNTAQQWRFTDLTRGGSTAWFTLGALQTFTMAVNTSGVEVTFTNPAGVAMTLSNNQYASWINTTDFRTASTVGNLDMLAEDFKFSLPVSPVLTNSVFIFDDFQVLQIPEPSVSLLVLMGIGAFLVYRLRRSPSGER
jgi:hypothetical protein